MVRCRAVGTVEYSVVVYVGYNEVQCGTTVCGIGIIGVLNVLVRGTAVHVLTLWYGCSKLTGGTVAVVVLLMEKTLTLGSSVVEGFICAADAGHAGSLTS